MADQGSLSSDANLSTPTPAPAGPSARKKPMFKKPDWLTNRQVRADVKDEAKSETKKNPEAVDIFSRSNDTHAAILAERDEKERRTREKKEGKSLKQTSPAETSTEDVRETKRQRRSTNEEDQRRNSDRRSVSSENTSPPSNSLSRRYNEAASAPVARPTQNNPIIIDLEDSDSDDGLPNELTVIEPNVNTVVYPGQKSREPPRSEDDPDEEFPELVAKAREQARQQEQQEQAGHIMGQGSASQNPNVPEEPDPVISILIDPLIPNTAPLLVKRRYRQKFKEVRLAWCAKNEIPEETRHKVFFTWRGRRMFDVASCRSIGIKLDFDGRPVMARSGDGYTESIDKIVLNATTLEIEEEAKKEKELAAREKERAARSPSPERKEPQYKVVMRSKGHPEQRLLVRKTTDVRRIADAFRRTNKIAPDKLITVNYDGLDLSLDTLVGDTEIIELEPGEHALLEVHIK